MYLWYRIVAKCKVITDRKYTCTCKQCNIIISIVIIYMYIICVHCVATSAFPIQQYYSIIV